MNANLSQGQALLHHIRIRRGLVFGVIIITALFAFEIFNYSTTEYALSDLLGDLEFMGIRWATILAIAFCGIDFAGIARLFTPEARQNQGPAAQNDSWYLFGAWLLAATMNAMLTWWGISLAILDHQTIGNEVVSREVLLRAVPIFVALLIWLIRVLIIGTFSVAGDRLFSQDDQQIALGPVRSQPVISTARQPVNSLTTRSQTSRAMAAAPASRPAPKPTSSFQSDQSYAARQEPTYHPLSASPTANTNGSHSFSEKPANYRTSSQIRR